MEKLSLSHFIHSYECGADGKLRLLTLFNLLQNIADLQAEKLGFGYKDLVCKNLSWVGAGYALHINQKPAWGDEIQITTWPSDKTVVSAIRDFVVKDKDENTLITASSQWVIIDINSGRPQALKKCIENMDFLPERSLNTTFPRIQAPTKTDFEKHFYVRYDDIDVNKHVNNSIYPVWASESVPNEFRETHEVTDMAIAFKRPSFFGDEILVQTQIDGNTTLHQIFSLDKTREFARVEIKWKTL